MKKSKYDSILKYIQQITGILYIHICIPNFLNGNNIRYYRSGDFRNKLTNQQGLHCIVVYDIG